MTRTTLTEAATVKAGRAGNMLVQLITPGVGSSGVYTDAVLEAAAATRVFPAGTLMFADHPTATEAHDRPERSIRDVAGVLVEDARWDSGALVAEAHAYAPWRTILAEMKDDIGVSIRAVAAANETDDQGRPVIAEIVEAISVDFVTKAGRGGAIREVYESARPALTVLTATEAATNVPTDPAGQSTATESPKGTHMATIQIDEADHRTLVEQAGRVTALEAERDQAIAERDTALNQVTEANRAADEATAHGIITAAEGHTFNTLETAGLMTQLPRREDGRLDAAAFTQLVATEAAKRAAEAGAGKVTGVGGTKAAESWDAYDNEFIPKGA